MSRMLIGLQRSQILGSLKGTRIGAGSFHSQGDLKMLEFEASPNGPSVYASASHPYPYYP